MDKTPGQVAYDVDDSLTWSNATHHWEIVNKCWVENYEKIAAAVIAHARPQIEREALLKWKGSKCAATAASDPPMDCNAPFCGCDPVMAHTVDSLIECGWQSADEVKQIEAAARRPFQTDGGQMKFITMKNGDIIRADVVTGVKYLAPMEQYGTGHTISVFQEGSAGSNFFGQYQFDSREECEAEILRIQQEFALVEDK